MTVRRDTRWLLPLLLVGTLLAAWLAGRWLQPAADVRLPADPACSVGDGPCTLRLPDGTALRLGLTPLPPRVMAPMTIDVAVDGQVQAMWVDFVGINMDMGLNRSELSARGAGLWHGEVVLPICSAAEMQWEARVSLQREGQRIEAPFRFTTRP
jgi:hypothetical protein